MRLAETRPHKAPRRRRCGAGAPALKKPEGQAPRPTPPVLPLIAADALSIRREKTDSIQQPHLDQQLPAKMADVSI